jgi:O-Antigen ligase
MRSVALFTARAVLLAGPAALAFAEGGFFDGARLVAGVVAWALVAAAALLLPAPLPHSRPARLALAALAGLWGWTALSLLWAPLAGPAYDDIQRLALYMGALLAATALLAERRPARAAEPAVAAGALIAVGYGLSERLLPGIVELTRSSSAAGRLDQPLTYWNATGALAALGLVLCARLAGDETRPRGLRAAAAAAAAPLGLGLYVTFSRGAVVAALAGLVVLVAARPSREQARGLLVVGAVAVAAALAGSPWRGVTALEGVLGQRELEGVVVLAALVTLAAAGALAVRAITAAETRGRLTGGELSLPRWAPIATTVVVLGLFGGFLAVAARDDRGEPRGATAARFGSVQSNRYEYWRVALRAWADHPVRGMGSGSYRVAWLRHREFEDSAHDAHSLYLETPAEMGLVGLLLLSAAFTAGGVAAARALRADPVLGAGPVAVAVAWALHAGIDWDWEMPAVTLPALLLVGLLLGAAPRATGSAVEYGVPGIGVRARRSAREGGALPTAAALGGWAVRYAAGLPRALARGRGGSFEFQGRRYLYLVHRHNHTWLNERAVEVPLARALVQERDGARVLEVGHVLGHYGCGGHDVVDKYERAAGVVNADVLEWEPDQPYDLIVSVSTLEHVGWDEEPRDPELALVAVDRLRGLLAPGGLLAATLPVGYHPGLDAAIREGHAGFEEVGALRWQGGLRWREVEPSAVWDAPFDRLLYRATGVLLCTTGTERAG